MSRLDSFIRRLEAQRACLDAAARAIAGLPGPVFELGLGNGRTFDHLRETCPDREIFVFERRVAAHPDCVPDADHLFLGDLKESLPAAESRFAGQVALVHVDIGSGDQAATREIAGFIAGRLPRFLRPGAMVASDQCLDGAGLPAAALPPGVEPGRYFLYRAKGAP